MWVFIKKYNNDNDDDDDDDDDGGDVRRLWSLIQDWEHYLIEN